MTSVSLGLKIRHGNDIRRLTFECEDLAHVALRWATTKCLIETCFQLVAPRITYLDSQKDHCTITSGIEFYEAVKYCVENKCTLLVLFVTASSDKRESKNEVEHQKECESKQPESKKEEEQEKEEQPKSKDVSQTSDSKRVDDENKEGKQQEKDREDGQDKEEHKNVSSGNKEEFDEALKALFALKAQHDELNNKVVDCKLLINAHIFATRLLGEIKCPQGLDDCGPDSIDKLELLKTQVLTLVENWKECQVCADKWNRNKVLYEEFRQEMVDRYFIPKQVSLCGRSNSTLPVLRKVANKWQEQKVVFVPLNSQGDCYIRFADEPNVEEAGTIFPKLNLKKPWTWSPILSYGVEDTIKCLQVLNV